MMPRSISRAALMALWAALVSPAAAEEPFDLLLRNGRIADGTGSPSFSGDVGLRQGRIAAVGDLGNAATKRSLDVGGLVVAPGFIDLMGQTALPLLEDPGAAINLLAQGITTINAGEGDSDAPLPAEAARSSGWSAMAEYLQLLDLKGLPVNVVQTVGHTQVRRLVLGDSDRQPTAAELERMREHVREAMTAGAIGLSTALIYPPAVYASQDEIASLAAVAGEHGGGYFTHLRNEGDKLLEAIDEAIAIGKAARTPVHIFHLKTAGRGNWGKMEAALARLQAARDAGLEATADIYPYVHNGLGIESFIHPRHFAAGREQLIARLDDSALRAEIRAEMESGEGWENWYRHTGQDWDRVILGSTSHERYRELAGRNLAALAAERGEDPWEVFFALVRSGAFVLPESMTEANKVRALREGSTPFCTDVGPAGGSAIASHPRGYGAFPRLLGRYVREQKVISLEQAVAQASDVAARQIFVRDRGRIAPGQAADIVVFDAARIADRATFAEPHRLAEGVRHVIVSGELVLEDGRQTPARPGRVLRGPGYRRPPASGEDDPRTAPLDFAARFVLERHAIPGAAVAVTAHGRLVYARGFGYADLAAREPVTPLSLFRLASISKPITATAVLQFVDDGRLRLEDRVFDILSFAPHLGPGASVDERQRAITIRQLLEHRGGWDRNVSFDPMFQAIRFAETLGVPPPAGPAEVIRIQSGLPLDFPPGERYAYSNYGYCLLGRVIETLTGKSYEDSVRERLLRPLGLERMRIGRTRLEQRGQGEVRYYAPEWGPSCFAADLGARVPHPYGPWHLEAMDAHGGWLGSAVDLARFACAFDASGACKVLKPESVRALAAPPEGPVGHESNGRPRRRYYGLGWDVVVRDDGGLRLAHSGSLPGTSTLLVCRHDRRNIVVLLNTRASPTGARLDLVLLEALEAAMGEVREWPEDDLFQRYR